MICAVGCLASDLDLNNLPLGGEPAFVFIRSWVWSGTPCISERGILVPLFLYLRDEVFSPWSCADAEVKTARECVSKDGFPQ